MPWYDGAVFVDPPAGQVLLDTGPLPGRTFYVSGFVRTSIPGWLPVLERRDAGNATTVQEMSLPMQEQEEHQLYEMPVTLERDERFRVVVKDAPPVGAEVEAHLWLDRLRT